jgi:hypothetical protein
MIVKSQGKRGSRTNLICKNCNEVFSELNFKIKQGKGVFCSNKCYQEYRKKNCKDKKERNKLYQIKTKYNLSESDYRNLFEEQNNKCAICGNTFNGKLKGFVDHDHTGNFVRGILCTKCNTLLGMANDNIEILENAIKYLMKSKR